MTLRNPTSRLAERVLRFLTASALRSTAIFVILTFVPILLLTYYIVATSIKSTRADAVRSDAQMRDVAVALLRANLVSEREALADASDSGALERALAATNAHGRPATAARVDAVASLTRLRRRRPEFLWLALYSSTGELQAVAPANAPAPLELASGAPAATATAPGTGKASTTNGAAAATTAAQAKGAAGSTAATATGTAASAAAGTTAVTLPPWFDEAIANGSGVSTLQPATATLPARLEFAAPVSIGSPDEGVLVGILPTDVVSDWLARLNVGADRYLYYFDPARQLVAATSGSPFPARDAASLPELTEALSGASGSGTFESPIQLRSDAVAYGAVPGYGALLLVRPVRLGFYLFRVFYDKLALIAMIVFLLAVASGLLLRSAFRYYQRYNREVESGRSKTEALLGSIGDGVLAVDAAGRVIEVNPAAAALIGLPAAEVLRRAYPEAIYLADERTGRAQDPIGEAMSRGQTLRVFRDLVLVKRDSTRLPVRLSAAPIRDEHGEVQGCVVVFNDASQEHEVDRLKNEFISLASHQLRTPMTGVKGALALLMEGVLGPLNAEQRSYLRRAYESNERLIALVKDLLNVSRLEQGRLQLRIEPVNLGAIVHDLVEELQPRATRYQQRLVWEAAPGADGWVQGDGVQLREVFANLIDNAIKYTPEHGQIRARLLPGETEVAVDVSDSGVGIPEDKLPALFQKFSRVQNPLSAREFGTGLGLYFARSIVALHGGTIEVSSRVGGGTTFHVTLPRQVAAQTAPAAATNWPASEPATPVGAGPRTAA